MVRRVRCSGPERRGRLDHLALHRTASPPTATVEPGSGVEVTAVERGGAATCGPSPRRLAASCPRRSSPSTSPAPCRWSPGRTYSTASSAWWHDAARRACKGHSRRVGRPKRLATRARQAHAEGDAARQLGILIMKNGIPTSRLVAQRRSLGAAIARGAPQGDPGTHACAC